jgi:hypothetical protein
MGADTTPDKPAAGEENPPVPTPEDAEKEAGEKKDEGVVETTEGAAARAGEAAEETAKPLVGDAENPDDDKEKPDEKVDPYKDIPEGVYKAQYIAMKQEIDANPSLKGTPAANLVLAFLLLAAKFGKIADAIPGRFRARLREDEVLNKERLDEKEIDAIKNGLELASDEDSKSKETAVKLKASDYGAEEASVRFLCAGLWRTSAISGDATVNEPFNDVRDASTLGARLMHTTRTVGGVTKPYYDSAKNITDLAKSGVKPGTVIIFSNFSFANAGSVENFKDAGKVAAYSIGDGNFRYYNAQKGSAETINIKEIGSLKVQAIFIPDFTKDESATVPATTPAPATAPAVPPTPTPAPEKPAEAAAPSPANEETKVGGKTIKEIAKKPEDVEGMVSRFEAKRLELLGLTENAEYDEDKLAAITAVFASPDFKPGDSKANKEELKLLLGAKNFENLEMIISEGGKKDKDEELEKLLK